jgi:hypothetical protein
VNDPATLTGQPKPVTAGDETRLIYPLDAEGIGRLQAWVDAQFPDPFEVVDRLFQTGRYNTAQQQFLMRTALELSVRGRRLIGTPEADALINSAAGTKFMLFLSISRGDPAFTEADAERFYGKMSAVTVEAARLATDAPMVVGGPKAGTPTGTQDRPATDPTTGPTTGPGSTGG